MFQKKTVKDINLRDKTVLMRVDFNVPLEDDGSVADDYRIEMALPTIKYLQGQNCKLALISHLGRPKGKSNPELSLEVVSRRLSELLGQEVKFVSQCVGAQVKQAVKDMDNGSIILLENVRFHSQETENSMEFAKEMAEPFEYFVQNAFGVVHRSHASTDAIANCLPAVAGFLIEKEVSTIRKALESPRKPVVAVVGGAKIHTKLELLQNLISVADTLVVGGAMANTFLVAMGYKVGKSLYDEEEVGPARTLREAAANANTELILPLKDVAVGGEVDASTKRRDIPTDSIQADDIVLDFGPKSMVHILEIIDNSGTVLWNGPLGMTELPQFATSTEALAHHMIDHHVDSIVGGGDTAGFVHELGLVDKLTHVSTGGGASLELMAGKPLPGVEVLLD